jgi:hypothetical protein
MTDPQTWDGLIEALNTWAEAREVVDGIEVTFETSTWGHRTVEVVMTPHGWEELAGTIRRETADGVREHIFDLPRDMPFLVCDAGTELVASRSRELPLDPMEDRDLPLGGEWSADGGRTKFAQWREPPA